MGKHKPEPKFINNKQTKCRARGMYRKVTQEELDKIIELKKTMRPREISRLVGRSIAVVVYADKKRPEKPIDLSKLHFGF